LAEVVVACFVHAAHGRSWRVGASRFLKLGNPVPNFALARRVTKVGQEHLRRYAEGET
jgi:hypothetical protein